MSNAGPDFDYAAMHRRAAPHGPRAPAVHPAPAVRLPNSKRRGSNTASGHQPPTPDPVLQREREAALEDIASLRSDVQRFALNPSTSTSKFLAPFGWQGHDLETISNRNFWVTVFLTGTLPFQLESPEDALRAMQTPLTAQQAVGGTSHFQMDYADDRRSAGKHQTVGQCFTGLKHSATLAAAARDNGNYLQPNGSERSAQGAAVMNLSSRAEVEAHIDTFRNIYNFGGLEVGTLMSRVSVMKRHIWFYTFVRGVQPFRLLWKIWHRLPDFVKEWEETLFDDSIILYASGSAAVDGQSTANYISNVKEFMLGCFGVKMPTFHTATRRLRMIRHVAKKDDLGTSVRPCLLVRHVLYVICRACSIRDDTGQPIDTRLRFASLVVAITGSRTWALRMGNITVGSRFDASFSPQCWWTFLSMSRLIDLKEGENAYAAAPRTKVSYRGIKADPFPCLFLNDNWNFVHALKHLFAIATTAGLQSSAWGRTPLCVMGASLTPMPQSFVYTTLRQWLTEQFPNEIAGMVIGTHCVRITAATVASFLGLSRQHIEGLGTWKQGLSAATAANASASGSAAGYQRPIREVLVEMQRYTAASDFETAEWHVVNFKGHDLPPDFNVQSEEQTRARMETREEFVSWLHSSDAAPAIQTEDDDPVPDGLFQANTAGAMQDLCRSFDIQTAPMTSDALSSGTTRITSYFDRAPSTSVGQPGPEQPASDDRQRDPLDTLVAAASSHSELRSARPHAGYQEFPGVSPEFARFFDNSQESSQSHFD